MNNTSSPIRAAHDFDWSARYPTIRTPIFARNVVATSQPLAAQAGLRMLQDGGNAVDAVIAAASAITLTEPVSNGLGSDAFAIVWDGHKLSGLNASGTAPQAWTPEFIRSRHGDAMPKRGWDVVTVPGAVAGWGALHQRFGKLPFAQCLGPAIELGHRGFGVSPITRDKWLAAVPELKDQPGFAQAFMPHGRAPEIGEWFKLDGAAATLERIAASGGADFYQGETAARILAYAKETGGALSAADLRDYQPQWVEPIQKDFLGYTLHEIPPNGQGIAALMALGILSHLGLGDAPVDSAQSQHLQIEAMKLAFADVYQYVADPRAMRVSVDQLLDDAYLAERARLVDRKRASRFSAGRLPSGGTIYLTAADEHGMMVSYIQSNYMGFGSGVVVPGTGVSLQNRGASFNLNPEHPNCVAPGKRPFHTIIPGFLTRDGQPQMSFGVMGGNIQPQGHLQTLVRMLHYRQQPQAACDAPRWKFSAGLSVDLEATASTKLREDLIAMGHQIESTQDSYMDFGSGQFIWRLGDPAREGYLAASDSRRDGCASGF